MDYTSLKSVAYNMLSDFGGTGTITFSTRTTYDVVNDLWGDTGDTGDTGGTGDTGDAGGTNTTYDINLVVVNHSEKDGSNGLKEGEKMFLFSSLNLPVVIDTSNNNTFVSIAFQGKTYEIKDIKGIDPNGEYILYKAIVRGA